MHWDYLLLWRVPQSLPLKNSPTTRGCYQHTLLLGCTLQVMSELVSFKHDAWNWSSSDQRIWGSFLVAFFVNSKCVFMCLNWREDWVWPHRHKALISVCLSFCKFLLSPHMIMSSNRVTIGFFVTPLTKALLHQLLSLAKRPVLGRILVVSNFFH